MIVKLHAYTGVFKFVDKDFKGMRDHEVNLEPWQAEFEATDHAVIKLYMYTPPEGELTSLAIGLAVTGLRLFMTVLDAYVSTCL